MHQNETFRFGSAGFAERDDLQQAGLFTQTPGALLVGFHEKQPLFYDGAGGILLTAGARSGKLRDILGYNICAGICSDSMLILDQKGELAVISQNQTPDNKACYYWNPASLHDLPQDRINPVDYATKDSPSLVSDLKVFCGNMIPPSGSQQSQYFEGRAQEFLEAICLTLVHLNGVLTLPDIYRVINMIPGGGDDWLDFAFEMHETGIPTCRRAEEEIASGRDNAAGGFPGILGELFKAFQCLSDPQLLASVSPPFTASLSDLCQSQTRANFYMMPPAEFLQAWSPVIKSLFSAGMIYKSRAPQAPRQTWIIDEAAQLRTFPLLTQLFTYGAGIGIRPVVVFQSTYQMEAIGQNAGNIITSSAACRMYFGVRDYESAQNISSMLGAQTLEYDDTLAQSQARMAKRQAAEALLHGGDPFELGRTLAHQSMASQHRTKQHRLLQTPEEILNAAPDALFLFTDQVRKPIYATRKPYWQQPFMAGRFHPNPYHPPLDRVSTQTRFGQRQRRVIREAVPGQFAHLPQYRSGVWSRIER